MTAHLRQGLLNGLRQHGADLLAHCADPHAELMALIWGPRFDRQQAHSLLAATTNQPSAVWLVATQAADGFDRLKPMEQQRLRHLIVRHQRRCHNFPCPEFS